MRGLLSQSHVFVFKFEQAILFVVVIIVVKEGVATRRADYVFQSLSHRHVLASYSLVFGS